MKSSSDLCNNILVIFLFLPDPCVPQNLVASVDCNMNMVSLSWDASNGTQMYMVSAEAGNQTTALTTNATTAYFSECTCGQNYSLAVTPYGQHCTGSSSASISVETCKLNTFYTH